MTKTLPIVFIFLSLFGYGQNTAIGSVSGKIVDSKSNKPVSGAIVYVVEPQKGATTDENGTYNIKNLTYGFYHIKVSCYGYSAIEKQITINNNAPLVVDFILSDSVFLINSIEIIADPIIEPQRIEKISSVIIESAPIRNLPELFDYSSGVTLSNHTGIFSSSTVVTLRGMPSNDQSRTLIVLDGVPLNKSDQGSVNWNRIDKRNIESVRIIKGPGPVRYGSGAMGGVIELTSRKPKKKIEGVIESEYGTYNTKKIGAYISGTVNIDTNKINQFYWRLNAFGRESDGYITEVSKYTEAADTFLAPVFLREINTFGAAGFNFMGNQNIELQVGFYDDIRGNGIKVFEDLGAYSTHQTLNFTGSYSGHAKFFTWTSKLFSIKEHFIKQYESMFENEYRLYEANVFRNDVGGIFDVSFIKIKKHEIQTGISYKRGSVDGKDIYFTSTDVISNKGQMDNYGLYLEDSYRCLDKKLLINSGVRYDFAIFHNYFFQIEEPSYSLEFYKKFETTANLPDKIWTALNPRLFLQYNFSSRNRIYFSVAKGFRAPILDDMTRNGKKRGTFKIANPNLQPEHLISTEIGGDVQLAKNITASSSFYYSIGNGFMYAISTGDSVNMGYRLAPLLSTQNISKVVIYGSEAELKYNLTENIALFANATYTHAQIKEHSVANPKVDSSLTNKYLTDIPDYKLGGGFSWKNKYLNINILYKYIGSTWVNEMNSVDKEIIQSAKYPGYGMLSIKTGYTIKKMVTLSLSVENVFNKIYINSDAQRNPGRLATGAIVYSF